MNIDLQEIEMLRERANVGYEEAKNALEKCNGNLVEALIYLERENKVKTSNNCKENGFFATIRKLIKKGNEIKFIVKKQSDVILKLPLTIMVIAAIVATPIVVISLIAAIVTGHKIRLEKLDGSDMEINETFDRVSTAVTNVSNQVVDSINKD